MPQLTDLRIRISADVAGIAPMAGVERAIGRIDQSLQRLGTTASSVGATTNAAFGRIAGATDGLSAVGQAVMSNGAAFRQASVAAAGYAGALVAAGQQASGANSIFQGLALTLAQHRLLLRALIPAAVIKLGKDFLETTADIDALRRSLTAVNETAEQAAAQFERLRVIARQPGMDLRATVRGVARLQALGFSAQQAERYVREFGNAIALSGGGRDDLEVIQLQLAQLAAKGRVLAQDLRPILERAPVVGRAMREAFGTVNPEDLQKMGVAAEDFIEVVVSKLEALPRAPFNLLTALRIVSDETRLAVGRIGEGFQSEIETVASGIARLARAISSLNVHELRAAFSAVATAATVLAAAFTGRLVGAILRTVAAKVQTTRASIAAARAELAEAQAARTAALAHIGMARSMGLNRAAAEQMRIATESLRAAIMRQQAAMAAASVTTRAVTAATNALKTAFAALGGWPGIIATGIALIGARLLTLKDQATQVAEAIQERARQIGESMGFDQLMDPEAIEKALRQQEARLDELRQRVFEVGTRAQREREEVVVTPVMGAQGAVLQRRGVPTAGTKAELDALQREMLATAQVTVELRQQLERATRLQELLKKNGKVEAELIPAPGLAILERSLETTLKLIDTEKELGNRLKQLNFELAFETQKDRAAKLNEEIDNTERKLRAVRDALDEIAAEAQVRIASLRSPVIQVSDVTSPIFRDIFRIRSILREMGEVKVEMSLRPLPEIQLIERARELQAMGASLEEAAAVLDIDKLRDAAKKLDDAAKSWEKVLGRRGFMEMLQEGDILGALREVITRTLRTNLEGLRDLFVNAPGQFIGGIGRIAQGDVLGGIGSVVGSLKTAFVGLIKAMGPAILIFEFVQGALKPLGPAIQAFLLPIRIVGEVVGKALVPVLKLFFPVIKNVAIAFTYTAQAAFTLAGGLLKGIGWIIEGIGKFLEAIAKFVNKIIPFADPLKPLEKAGREIANWGKSVGNTGDELLAAAKDIAKSRDELRGLSWEEAMERVTETAESVSEALRNVPTGFKVALARFRATTPAEIPAGAQLPAALAAGGAWAGTTTVQQFGDVTVVVQDARDPEATARAVVRQLEKLRKRGAGQALRPALQGA